MAASECGRIEVVVENGALVAPSATIGLPPPPAGSDGGEVSAAVKLTVSPGNVFHPGAILTLIPRDREGGAAGEATAVRVDGDNLFEEGCEVSIDLNLLEATGDGGGGGGGDGEEISVIGRHNQFAPLCQLNCGKIGSGNSFEASCHVRAKRIGDGSVFAPLVTVDMVSNGDEGEGPSDSFPLDNTVFYSLQEGVWGSSSVQQKGDASKSMALIQTREHSNGLARNVREVELLLSAARKILS